MLGRKKTCGRCGSKSSARYEFCPYCGSVLDESAKKEREADNLFDSDFSDFLTPKMNMGFPINSLFKALDSQMKALDKEMPRGFDEKQNPIRNGISISISSTGGQPVIKVRNLGQGQGGEMHAVQRNIEREKPMRKINLSEKEAERISRLPKEEPGTSVRRLSNKVIYEIDLPGVKENDIIINRLQNSIEIKAFTKDKAFFKLIPVALPLLKYYMDKEKLVLELKPEN